MIWTENFFIGICPGWSQLKTADTIGIWTHHQDTGSPVLPVELSSPQGLQGSFYPTEVHEIFLRQLNACSWEDMVSPKCKFKSYSSQYFSLDFRSVRLSQKKFLFMFLWGWFWKTMTCFRLFFNMIHLNSNISRMFVDESTTDLLFDNDSTRGNFQTKMSRGVS